MKSIWKELGISSEASSLILESEQKLHEAFARVEAVSCENTMRVMKAFCDNHIGEAHFAATSGYGYDDLGRDALDRVYADVFGAEDALVRHNFVSGTHTLSIARFGVLRPGDFLLFVTGRPYDTLEEAIGLSGEPGSGSLRDFGIGYEEIALDENGKMNLKEIQNRLAANPAIRMVFLQRSCGYHVRPTLSCDEIAEAVQAAKAIRPDVICMVDNCYGEFVETQEPTAVGADLMAGSLIKNPGGGLAPTGGYIAGRADLVKLCAYRLTSVGIGKECGATLGLTKSMFQGFFFAPHVVAQAVRAALLAAQVFETLGYKVYPSPRDVRHDIIQTIQFRSPDELCHFCRGIQKGAPVDSFVTPEPWDMPGYSDPVIMAAGAFVQGASIELSADAPMRPPYTAYLQGGLTYESARYAIMVAAQNIMDGGR